MDILQLATFPCALFLVLWAWVSLAAAKDEPETWRMRHTERGCTGSGCFYRFIIQEAQNTGDDGVYCEVSVSPVEVDHFSSKRCKEWTATNDPLETYRIDAERDLDTNDFIITVANMERQLSTTFSFSKEQWQAMQVPPDSINHRPGQQGWTWDFAGVAVSMFVGETVRSRSEDAAAKNRTIPDDLAPEVEKRAAPKREIWHLNKLCHYSELDSSLSMKVTRSFEIQESNTGTHGFKCRITTSSKTGLSWDSALCDEQDLGSMAWMYDATGTYSEDGTLFTIEVENMHKNRDKQRIAFFEIDAKVWNDAVYPNNIQSIEVVALPTLPDYNSGIMGRQWTIGEELEADTKDDIGGRRRTRVAPETLPRVSNVRIEASSPESRPLEVRRAHKRVFSRLRSPIEQGGLVDAPQWTTDGLTRGKFSAVREPHPHISPDAREIMASNEDLKISITTRSCPCGAWISISSLSAPTWAERWTQGRRRLRHVISSRISSLIKTSVQRAYGCGSVTT